MLALEKIAYGKKDRELERIEEKYLQLPETLPQSVYRKAEELTGGIESPYLKAAAIESWLSENCAYTLTPGDVPEGRDFVEYFLETKAGYCEYFASAMTILARCAGLPARYAAGYGMKRAYEHSANLYTATKATAHAWSEVYFKGIGWVVFDASKWVFDEPIVPEEPEKEKKTPEALPAVIQEPFPEPTAPPAEDDTPSRSIRSGNGKTMLAAMLLITACFMLYLIVRFLLSFVGAANYYRRLCRRYKSREERLDAAYRRLVKQAAFLGVRMVAGDTISSFAARVDEKEGNRLMTRVCTPVILHRFALEDIRNEDIRSLCDHYIRVEREIRKKLGVFRYAWRRFVAGIGED